MNRTCRDSDVVGSVEEHLLGFWRDASVSKRKWTRGPAKDLGHRFVIFEVSPTPQSNNLWVYCTAGSTNSDDVGQEFFLVSETASERHVETLTMLSHYHRFEARLGVGHIVKIGRAWTEESKCDQLLISLPYPFGPKLEWLETPKWRCRFLWALPISEREAAFAKENGVERLEQRFDAAKLRYWDPCRVDAV
jgi:hypothetical protein